MTRIFEDDLQLAFATRVVHAGQRPDDATGAIMPAIYQTSTYVQPALGRHKGFEYARTRNPTRDALERNVAALEGAAHGFAFASGSAATDVVLKLLSAGDHVICGENVYGGTHRHDGADIRPAGAHLFIRGHSPDRQHRKGRSGPPRG